MINETFKVYVYYGDGKEFIYEDTAFHLRRIVDYRYKGKRPMVIIPPPNMSKETAEYLGYHQRIHPHGRLVDIKETRYRGFLD